MGAIVPHGNRAVIIVVAGLVVVGAIAALVYRTARPNSVQTTRGIESPEPKAQPPVTAPPPATRSKPATATPPAGGTSSPTPPTPKAEPAPTTGVLVLESDTP